MYEEKAIVASARVTDVKKVTSLSEEYRPEAIFSVFLAPKDGGNEAGDVVEFEAELPHTKGEYVDVPVVVGDWSPIVFKAIKASAIDLTKVTLYAAPMKVYDL